MNFHFPLNHQTSKFTMKFFLQIFTIFLVTALTTSTNFGAGANFGGFGAGAGGQINPGGIQLGAGFNTPFGAFGGAGISILSNGSILNKATNTVIPGLIWNGQAVVSSG